MEPYEVNTFLDHGELLQTIVSNKRCDTEIDCLTLVPLIT